MKKILAIMLVACMALSILAGCQPAAPTTGSTAAPNATDPKPTDSKPTTPPVVENATYTYNVAWGEFPARWNPHTYEESTDGEVLGYITDGFYTFDYNEDETGFAMVPAMTTDEHPVDITSEYVGKWGIQEGDKALVYKINLRDDLCWDNGDKITAHDFVESAKRLLNPKAQNYRADSMYSNDVVIYGAENYLKQGQKGWFAASDPYKVYSADLDEILVFTLSPVSDSVPAKSYVRSYLESIGAPKDWTGAQASAYILGQIGKTDLAADAANLEGKTLAEIKADPALKAAWEAVLSWWQTEPNEELHFFATNYTYPELAWEDNVGIFALSDLELVYVLTDPMEGFYLKYGLPSGYLVHLETYDACESIDADGLYSNTYCTSAETSPSYGTYSLSKFQTDKELEFVRNDKWYGLEEGTYQTTHINVQCVKEAATREGLLKQGLLDSFGLDATYAAIYGKSDHTYFSESPSTFAITFNPDMEALKTAQEAAGANINKTIITLVEFRMAMSFGMNRTEFVAATNPLGVAGFGLFSDQHIVDPDLGLGYRSTEQAKEVLVEFWGLKDDIGPGKLYEDMDDAIASLTGYNPDMAKAKFNEAYDKAIAEGLMDSDDVVEILIGVPALTYKFYENGYNFIENHYKELVKGTKLEGKLTFKVDDTLGNDYANALKQNRVDMLFGVGWQGMAMNPYGLIMAYMTSQYQYDAHTDYTQQSMEMVINGKKYTASVNDWYLAINGQPVTLIDADGNKLENYVCGSSAAAEGRFDERLSILAGLEKAVLMNYNFIPITGDAGASIKGMQIKYYKEEYNMMMGFGGLKYMTYYYTDAEWAEYVASQGGELDYT